LAKPRGEARFIDALSACRRVNLDTNALIYYLEDRRPYADLMEAVFELIDRGELEAVVSSIAQMELLVKPIRENDLEAVDEIMEFTEQTANLRMFEVSRAVALQAALIRAEGLPVPDALIIATGAAAECDATITNDGDWRRAVEVLAQRPAPIRGDAPPPMPRIIYLKDYIAT
jgi:predicted nucleic acid-binding protein